MGPIEWGTLIRDGAIAVLAIIAAVATLLRTMGHSYGSIITALQAQNAQQQAQIESQQQQIDTLRREVAAEKEDCRKRLAEVERTVQLTITDDGGTGARAPPRRKRP